MPRKMLTDLACERVKPPAKGRIEYSDAACAALVLRVTAAGQKTWSVYYRFGGKHRRYTIGTYPAVKPAQARRQASETIDRLQRDKIDPSAQKRALREARAPEQDTFAALVQDYLDQYAGKNTSAGTFKETKRVLDAT